MKRKTIELADAVHGAALPAAKRIAAGLDACCRLAQAAASSYQPDWMLS